MRFDWYDLEFNIKKHDFKFSLKCRLSVFENELVISSLFRSADLKLKLSFMFRLHYTFLFCSKPRQLLTLNVTRMEAFESALILLLWRLKNRSIVTGWESGVAQCRQWWMRQLGISQSETWDWWGVDWCQLSQVCVYLCFSNNWLRDIQYINELTIKELTRFVQGYPIT